MLHIGVHIYMKHEGASAARMPPYRIKTLTSLVFLCQSGLAKGKKDKKLLLPGKTETYIRAAEIGIVVDAKRNPRADRVAVP